MKKLFFLAIVAILAFGCSKEEEPPQIVAAYSVYFKYSPRAEVEKDLPYDAQFVETLYFYEYDVNNNKIGLKMWEKPGVGQEKTFVAEDNATKVVIFYEIKGKLYDGREYANSRYFQEVINLSKGNVSVIALTATSKLSKNSPI